MRRFQKATIHDVATKAGVSITTVSRFVSGRKDVCSVKTAERIRTAIDELNYTPSSLVGSVSSRPTRTLGVYMYNPLDPEVAFGKPFFERLWRGVIAQSDVDSYSLLHYPSDVRNSLNIDAFLDGRVDGLLYNPPSPLRSPENEDVRTRRLSAAGMPTALLTRSRDLPDNFASAYANEADTVNLALSLLWDQGHRRIAHLAGPLVSGTDIAISRLEAYREWMQARGAYDPALEGHSPDWRAQALVANIVAGWDSLESPPTAVFAVNDALALGVIAATRALGREVPRDLSVVGVDNSPEAESAGLTSVDSPVEEVGRSSVRALLNLIQGAPIAECRIAVPVTRIVLRNTVASLNQGQSAA